MKKYHHGLKRIVSLLIALGMLLMVSFPVFAEDTSSVNQAVKDDRKGVVQVRIIYTDDSGKHIPIQGGTGFLVGKDNTSTTVITNNHVIKVSDHNTEALKNMFPGFDPSKVTIDIVVKGDVTIGAEYKKGSEAVDFAILELSQPIGGKEPLKLATDSELDDIATQTAYALGFPDVSSYIEDFPKYTTEQVNVTSGTIGQQSMYEGSKILQHNCDMSYGNSGGPLVNANGAVIGVNTANLAGTGYNVALDIREISSILTMLNIAYETSGTAAPGAKAKEDGAVNKASLKEAITAAESKDTSKYKEASVAAFKGALNDAKSVNNDVNAKQDVVDAAVKDLNSAVSSLEKNTSPNWLLIGGIIAGVVIIVIIIIIVIANKNKKKRLRQQKPQEKIDNIPVNNRNVSSGIESMDTSGNVGSGATDVIGFGDGSTTMLEEVPYAMLQRKSTNDTIQLTKPVFKIGKEKRKVDYCISDNTSVSRVHITIEYRDGAFYLKDNNATNGTYINEGRISSGQEVKLKNGDKIKLSNEEFEFKG
ncbi:MAG: trypsin-like peptidase domain-containing protein [Eubacterium sp.]